MMHLTRRFHRQFVLFAIVVGSAMAASQAAAEEELRWKLTKGEKLDYVITLNSDMNMNLGPQGQAKATVMQQTDMTWEVQGVDESGNATILLSTDRMQLKTTGPQSVEYDSQSEEAPAGMAAMIAPLFEAMTKGKFEFTMSPLGEVTNVVVPQEVIDALKNSPGAQMMGDMASAEGFKQTLSQGTLVLPKEMPTAGFQWTSSIQMKNPMVGQQNVETTYTYDGTKDVDGKTYDLIKPSVKMSFEGQGPVQMTLKDQKSGGEILFDRTAGRLHSSKIEQDMAMGMNIAGQAVEQEIHQVIDVQVTPAE